MPRNPIRKIALHPPGNSPDRKESHRTLPAPRQRKGRRNGSENNAEPGKLRAYRKRHRKSSTEGQMAQPGGRNAARKSSKRGGERRTGIWQRRSVQMRMRSIERALRGGVFSHFSGSAGEGPPSSASLQPASPLPEKPSPATGTLAPHATGLAGLIRGR